MQLNPTLWRTCRVLAGPTRLRLLRLVLATPGNSVSQLAEEAEIHLSRASQELRRVQSRGLIGVKRQGSFVRYLPEPDPQVPSAHPLLLAMKAAFALGGAAQDKEIGLIATALSHPRRLLIYRELLDGPRTIPMLRMELRIPFDSLFRHLQVLERGGLVRQKNRIYRATRNSHPLAQCLAGMLKPAK
ncbi:MAG TPA: hypothetical protein DCM68_08700 [Verrucomicrobia bacterium]|nr:hypothetical protein [Verrucomicrobiota bacterium]